MNEQAGISEELTPHMGGELPEPAGSWGGWHGWRFYYFLVGASLATGALLADLPLL
jgi:hypothetical protein